MIPYPQIDPILFQIGPFALRWYSLAYILGVIGGIQLVKQKLMDKLNLSSEQVWNMASYIIVGIIIGGRLGYVLIYDLGYYSQNWREIMAIWQGGMSYHGGALGAMIGMLTFARVYKKNPLVLLDYLALGSTIGIGLGRLANFINGELYGRITTMPWGMIFPNGGILPRHPSQLYEAFLEGAVLMVILMILDKKPNRKPGQLFGYYLLFYGIFRVILEFFREPDAQLGFVVGFLSMGQVLSLLMITIGALLLFFRTRIRN